MYKVLLATMTAAVAAVWTAQAPPSLPLERITLPPGFSIAIYASGVPHAREMVMGAKGTLFVGSRDFNKVYALVDRDHDQKADQVYTIAEGLKDPSGVAFRDGSLYVAEISRITRYDNIEASLEKPPVPVVVKGDLPTESHHGQKFIRFGPDGLLYVPVGGPCNVCERPEDPRFATILRMKPDGTGAEIFASGVRNSVGFDWHPTTHEMWFTVAISLVTTSRPTSSTAPRRKGWRSGSPTVMPARSRTRSSVRSMRAASFRRPRANSIRTAPRSACGSTPARCFPPSTAIKSSSPSTDRGIEVCRSAIA
jgi:hypothetical protein